MAYYTATEFQNWEATAAKSLSGAKAVASARNAYVGTTIHVAVKHGDYFERVAVKRNGEWQNVENGYVTDFNAADTYWEGMGK